MADLSQVIQRGGGLVRSGAGRLGRLGRYGGSFAAGKIRAVTTRSGPKQDMDDKTLQNKVETEIFRPADAPKDKVVVNVLDGVVELRGEVKRPQIKKELEAKARAVPEVRDVKNLLHLPKTPAPTRADSPGRSRRKASTGTTGGPKRAERVNTEKPVEGAEPAPEELAKRREGRKAAPLGGKDPAAGS